MIVILKPSTNADAVTRLEALLHEHGAQVSRSQAGQHPILSVDSPSPTIRVQIASLCKSCADVAAVVELVRVTLAEFGLTFGTGSATDAQLRDLPGSYVDHGGGFFADQYRQVGDG